jgi:hypothetical protein
MKVLIIGKVCFLMKTDFSAVVDMALFFFFSLLVLVVEISADDVKQPLIEESSFATLFPKVKKSH